MTLPVQKSALPKGHIRCYSCSKTAQASKGGWHENNDRQIFLCKTCEPTSVTSQVSKQIINPRLRYSNS